LGRESFEYRDETYNPENSPTWIELQKDIDEDGLGHNGSRNSFQTFSGSVNPDFSQPGSDDAGGRVADADGENAA
jgi:hypothetical protein